MRIRTLLLLPLLAAFSASTFAVDTWTAKAAFPGGARFGAVSFTVGHKGYIGMGQLSNVNLSDVWEYDPVTNAWAQKANFGGGLRSGAVAFVVGNKAFVGTGTNGTAQQDLWQFDPVANTWTGKAAIGGPGRSQAVAFSIGSFGYIGTGLAAGNVRLNDLWRYDPASNQWLQRANFTGTARMAAVGFSVGNFGYIGTGDDGALKDDMRSYDPALNTWSTAASVPGGVRTRATSWSMNNKGYVCAGLKTANAKDLWEYDAGNNIWTQRTDFAGTARFFPSSFVVAGKAYMGVGVQSITSGFTDFYQYDPGSQQAPANSWTRRARAGSAAANGAVGFSIGNKGYFSTGLSGSTRSKDLWEFDPGTNAWSQKVSLPGVARSGAAGFAIGNKGYVGTGTGPGSVQLQDFFAYDPTNNTWITKASLPGAAREGATGFAIGSKGYITTGNNSFGFLSDTWEYDPSTDQWTQKADFAGGVRIRAAGFAIGALGYVGTGTFLNPTNDLWAFDPVANAWTPKAALPGVARFAASAFAIGTKGYICCGATGDLLAPSLGDLWEYDVLADGWTQRATLGPVQSDGAGGTRSGAPGFAIGGKGYIGGGINGGGSGFNDFWEYEPGPVSCSANQVTLTLNTDAFASETRWEIVNGGTTTQVCSGTGYANSSVINIPCCLLNGCYDLRVFDSFGDGMSTGGFVLKDASNQRIIDNTGNGAGFTFLSQVTNGDGSPWSFCLPIGTDALVPASCDQTFSLANNIVVQVQENPLVTAQQTASPATSGYQICIVNATGGVRRNVFLSFAAPGTAFPTGTPNALKPTFFNLNFSTAPFLPIGKLLNVRVRAKVNGVFNQCGPACRMTINAPACTPSQLTTTASPSISCGATNVNVNSGLLFCTLVPGANLYKMEFTGPNNYGRNITLPATTVNSIAARTLNMSTMVTGKPACGVAITVRVRASFDGGTTFCDPGPACTVTFTGCPPAQQARALEDEQATGGFTVWPNPCGTGLLNLRIDALADAVETATIDVVDVFGKRVVRQALPVGGTRINTAFDLGPDVAEGLYFVTVTVGEKTFVQRVVITR